MCERISEWQNRQLLAPVFSTAGNIQKAYGIFLNCDEQIFDSSPAPFEQAQEAAAQFMGAVREVSYKLEEMLHSLREEQDRRRAALVDLRKNIKDYR